MATRDSDSSSSSTVERRIVCELSPKGKKTFKWQSSTNLDGDYLSAWDKSAKAKLLEPGAKKYWNNGPITPTSTTVSVRWYIKDAQSNEDEGMTGSASDG